MHSGDLVARVIPVAQQKNTNGYLTLYVIILVALSVLLVFVIGLAVVLAAYVQDITPLLATVIISLVIVSFMVACIVIYRKRKRPA
jgi:hypothetical protein